MSILQALRSASLVGLLLCATGADAQAQWGRRNGARCAGARYSVPAYRGLPAQGYGYGYGGYGSGRSVSIRLGGDLGQAPAVSLRRTRVRYSSQTVWVPEREVLVEVDGVLQRRLVGGYYARQQDRAPGYLAPAAYRSGSSSHLRIRL